MQDTNSTSRSKPSGQCSDRSPTERHLGLDVGRLIAAFFVVAIHAGPGIEAPGLSGEILNQTARFAVPFFFCVSGFLFAKSYRNAPTLQTLWRYERRILSLFLFWSAVYFLNPGINGIQEHGWAGSYRLRWETLSAAPVNLMLEGTALHLWFLVSLAMSLFIVWLANKRSVASTLVIGLLLYGVALLAGPYRSVGIPIELGFNPRDGPFFSTIFVVLGFFTGWTGFDPSRRTALTILLSGALLHGLEIARFSLLYHTSPFGFNYVLGTLFFGYGAFLLTINWKPSNRFAAIARLGPLATGIYCVHVLFVKKTDFFDVFFPESSWGFVRTILVFLLALAASMLAARIPLLKRFVT